jgi:hypothetical protein
MDRESSSNIKVEDADKIKKERHGSSTQAPRRQEKLAGEP